MADPHSPSTRERANWGVVLLDALREFGLITALQGNVPASRKCLDESLAVAERQGARFEYAQTLLARGRIGQQHDWPQAQQDLTTAEQSLRSLGADFVLERPATNKAIASNASSF